MENPIALVNAISERGARLGRVLSVLQGKFGGAAEPGERRAKVMGEIVERFPENAHMRGILVEQSIELADKGSKFATAVGHPNTGRGVPGFENPACGIGDLAQWTGRMPREQGGDHGRKSQDGDTDRAKGMPQGSEQHGTVVGAATDLDQAPVEQRS